MVRFSSGPFFPHRHIRDRVRAAFVLVAVMWLGIVGHANAVDPGKLLTQYGHTAWRLQDGELPAPAFPFAQTSDGYLWVGTQAGPLRFDGVNFVSLETLSGSPLRDPYVMTMLGASDGTLWIGTPSGLVHWKNGRLINYAISGGTVLSLAEDQGGKIWLLTQNKEGKLLCEVAGTGVTCHGKDEGLDVTGTCCDRMVTDRHGTFWIGTDTTLVRWRAGAASKSFPIEAKIKAGTPGTLALAPEPDGSLWVGLPMPGPGLGLQRLVGDQWRSFKVPAIDGSSLAVEAMLRDRHGALWVGTGNHGIYRIAHGRVDHFDSKDGLTSDNIYSFFEDEEGNMWVSTSGGIDRFRDLKVWSYTTREGVSIDEVDSIAAGHDGKVWVGTANGLDVIDRGQVRSLRSGKELPGTQVTSLFEDKDGRLWVGIDKGLWIYAAGKFTAVPYEHQKSLGGLVTSMAQDTGGDIWASISYNPKSILRIRHDKVVEAFNASVFPTTRSMASDRRGNLWLGLANGNLMHSGTKPETILTHLDSPINNIIVTSDGLVLGGARKGLVAFKDGALRILSTKDGLPCDAVNGLTEGDSGALWLYMGCGLAKTDLVDLERALSNPAQTISTRFFDVFDGVRPGYAPFKSAARAPDGSLWFANGVIAQTIDPHAVSGNSGPLPVHTEQLVADQHAYPLSGELKLPALTRNVRLDYTAIALAIPQHVHFRYRLDGRDLDWMDAGTRRQAFYTDLPPGHYSFHVEASIGNGPWEDARESAKFTVLPAFYQTRWFILLVVALGAVALWLLFVWRLAHVKVQMRALLEERHVERERIARELHDTFLQGVQGLMFRFQIAMERIPPSQPARELMENALDHADQVIAEGRDRVTQLRAQPFSEIDLPSQLQLLGEGLAQDSHVTFRLTVEGMPKPLDPAVNDEVERIAHETLTNAFRHAKATEIDVVIGYARKRLILSITDNGCGFDVDKVIRNGPIGHWGLKGIHERAARLHAHLTLSSRIGAGTAVELVVPGALAFGRFPKKLGRRVDLLRMMFTTRYASTRALKNYDE